MKSLALTIVAFTVSLAHPGRISAQSAQFVFTPLSPALQAPGGTFEFRIDMIFTPGGTVPNAAGVSLWVEQTTNLSFFYFSIIARDTTGSLFADDIWSDSDFSVANPDPLNSTGTGVGTPVNAAPIGSNTKDLGRLTATHMPITAAGTYFICNLTLQVAPNAPLPSQPIYVASVSTAGKKGAVNEDSGLYSKPVSPASILVIVPEPTTWSLLLVAALPLLLFTIRQHRNARHA